MTLIVAFFLILLAAFISVTGTIVVREFARQQRSAAVHDYRFDLLQQIGVAAKEDIHNGIFKYQWRYEMFDTVSYDDMVNSKAPLDSFYPDKTFLHPSTKPYGVIDVDSWEIVNMKGELNP